MDAISGKARSFKAIKVFYSYAHKDEELKDELVKHLKIYEHLGLIESWHDRMIVPGQEWSSKINTHLNEADLILLLISTDFIASEYCYTFEMARALERHRSGEAHTIPIILRPCNWKGAPFGQLQALPADAKAVTSWANRDEAFTSIAEGISEVIEQQFGRPQAASYDKPVSEPAPAPEIPPLMPYLCDRKKQEENLEDCLLQPISERSQRPLVCFIHGHENECLDKYKEKLQEEVLPDLFRPVNTGDLPVETLFLPFPDDTTNARVFVDKLRRSLGDRILRNKSATDKDIAEVLSKRRSPLMIHAYPNIKDWECDGPEIINAFVDYWNHFPDLAPGPLLINCLFFIYKGERKDNRARNVLTEFKFRNYIDVHGTTLQELNAIEADEVKNWFRDDRPFLGFCVNHPYEFCRVQEALDEIGDFYKEQEPRHPKKGVSMKILAGKVKTILEKRCS